MAIDLKYCSQSTKVLEKHEVLQEGLWDKRVATFILYDRDLKYCKKHGINLSRILRLKLHEWLVEKGAMIPEDGEE